MKRMLLSILLLFGAIRLHAQQIKATKEVISNTEEFTAKTGVEVIFEDYPLNEIKLVDGVADARIRKLILGGGTKYYYQITNVGREGTKTGTIPYVDLLELHKNFAILKKKAAKDNFTSLGYIENKFLIEDGFKIGYFILEGELSWYMVLEKPGKDNTIRIENAEIIDTALDEALQKITELSRVL